MTVKVKKFDLETNYFLGKDKDKDKDETDITKSSKKKSN